MAKQQEMAMAQRGEEAAMLLKNHDTDSPTLPVEEMEKLHSFRPDVIDWILDQTKIEAENRRALKKEMTTRLLSERRMGQVLGFLIGIAGVIGGAYVAVNGSATAGGIIATSAICTLAVAFLGNSNKENTSS